MLQLDHLTVIAPTLAAGVAHVRACLDLDVPFGQRHAYMGTHNHLLQLGDSVYLEIIAVDPTAERPRRARWFGLDEPNNVQADWDAGRRLRGWVARTHDIDRVLARDAAIFGTKVALPPAAPTFHFAIPDDGRLPLDGAAPSIIDRLGQPRAMTSIADLGARLRSYTLEHPDPPTVSALYDRWHVDRAPQVDPGDRLRYRAQVMTSTGLRELT